MNKRKNPNDNGGGKITEFLDFNVREGGRSDRQTGGKQVSRQADGQRDRLKDKGTAG